MINLVQFANYNVAMVVFKNEACANKIWQRQTVIILLIRVPSSCSTMAITTTKRPSRLSSAELLHEYNI